MRLPLFLLFFTSFFLIAKESYETIHEKFSHPGCYEQNRDFCQKVHRIVLNEFPRAYNPSLIYTEHGYTLFFRFDEFSPHQQKNSRFSCMTYVGCVELNRSFMPISNIKVLDLKSSYAEDPRCILFENQLYLFYNDIDIKEPSIRKMKMAILEPKTKRVLEIVDLPGGKKRVEKNWTPFVYQKEGEKGLYFVYDLSLFHVYKLEKQQEQWKIEPLSPPSIKSTQKEFWEKEFGSLRGGAPLIQVDGELFCFYHSSFYEKKPFWQKISKTCFYHMGLITFCEKTLEPKGMLPFPIFYSDAFATPRGERFNKWVIYPSGAVYNKEEGKVLVSLGENDRGMLILEFDKEIFSKKLVPIEK
jgi:predicted GH43/DUF377 family glycosyl hydrolase